MSTQPNTQPTQPTQVRRPWRATARTVFQALIAFAAMWAIIVETIGLDPSWQWVAVSLAVTGAITRLMALPVVEDFLERFVPFLAADPGEQAPSDRGDTDIVGIVLIVLLLIVVLILLGVLG